MQGALKNLMGKSKNKRKILYSGFFNTQCIKCNKYSNKLRIEK